MLETVKLNSSPDVSRQNARTKECVALRQVSWYHHGTFSVGNQTKAMCQPERVWMGNDIMKVKKKHWVQKEKAWVTPQRVGSLCNPTQMWIILHLITQAVNVPLFPQTVFNINNPQTTDCTKKFSAAVRITNRQRETQATADLLIHTWLCWHTTHNAIWRYILWPMPRSATT